MHVLPSLCSMFALQMFVYSAVKLFTAEDGVDPRKFDYQYAAVLCIASKTPNGCGTWPPRAKLPDSNLSGLNTDLFFVYLHEKISFPLFSLSTAFKPSPLHESSLTLTVLSLDL